MELKREGNWVELSPEKLADLEDMLARYRHRREQGIRIDAAVTHHDWSPAQAKLNGLRNSRESLICALRKEGPLEYMMDQLEEVIASIAFLEANGVTT